MSTPHRNRKEQPNTYFVQDRASQQELERLVLQDQFVTKGMDGPLAEQSDPAQLRSVLDVACGTGGWLIQLAQLYPSIERLVGVDISAKMMEYANAQAVEVGLSERVEFRVMDALSPLDFPPASFDLVNLRLGMSFMRKWDWPVVLRAFQNVTRPGGVIRVSESTGVVPEKWKALRSIGDIYVAASYQAGLFFTPELDGVIRHLAPLFTECGMENVQTHLYHLTYRAGTEEWKRYTEDMSRLYRALIPFFQKWTRLPDNYDELYQQAMQEMQQPDFETSWNFLTVWGNVPLAKNASLPPTT